MLINEKSKVVMADIDGTLKDLVKENTDALIKTMKQLGGIDMSLRGRFVLSINKLNMYFIKTGLFPTNKIMQRILILIYSALLLKPYVKFRDCYFSNYNKENIWFEGVKEKLENIFTKQNEIYLVTKNIQNKSIEVSFIAHCIKKVVISDNTKRKYYTYKKLIEEQDISKNNLVIIGDNFWDDVLPALAFGVKVIWCDMYNCRLKQVFIKILRIIFKNVFICTNVDRI